MSVSHQSDLAEQGRCATGALIREGVDLLAQLRPVVSKAMCVEYVAAQPPPELLEGIGPGRVGWQPDGLDPGQLAEHRQHVGMVVGRPVVLHDVDAPGIWIDLIEAAVDALTCSRPTRELSRYST